MLNLEEVKTAEDEEFNRQSKEAYKLASEVDFDLTFNKNESVYSEVKKLDKPVDTGLMVGYDLYDCGDIYTDLKSKRILIQRSLFEKDFLIDESLPVYNWNLFEETKSIGGYTCYKAETVIQVSKEQKEAYDKKVEEYSKKKTTIFPPKEPKEFVVTAWYTPDIPVNVGPENYLGLPGLILEVHDNLKAIYCTKVIFNKSNKQPIKFYRGGKTVTQKQYNDIEKKIWSQYSEIQK